MKIALYIAVPIVVLGLMGLNLYQMGQVSSLQEMNDSLQRENLDLAKDCSAVASWTDRVMARSKIIRDDYRELQRQIIHSVPEEKMGAALTRWASHEPQPEDHPATQTWWQRLLFPQPTGMGGPD